MDIKKGWIAALVSAAILLLPGIPLTYVGVRLFGERHDLEDGYTNFIFGGMTLLVGSGLCLAATTVFVVFFICGWEAKANEAQSSRVEPRSSFEKKGNDTHCRKCGFELIGPGGPCRKCDDVQTSPCASCGRYILDNDKTCVYCGAKLK